MEHQLTERALEFEFQRLMNTYYKLEAKAESDHDCRRQGSLWDEASCSTCWEFAEFCDKYIYE